MVVEREAVHQGPGDNSIVFPGGFWVSLQRTLRIPDDGGTYPFPPGFGEFPLLAVDPDNELLPGWIREAGGFMIPMRESEALFLYFGGGTRAVQVGTGAVNALTGGSALCGDPQDYLVTRETPWLDGILGEDGTVRQFVASRLGVGHSVEEQATGNPGIGGLRLRVVPRRPGFSKSMLWPGKDGLRAVRVPEDLVVATPDESEGGSVRYSRGTAAEALALGAAGRIHEQVERDGSLLSDWDESRAAEVVVHIIAAEDWTRTTGEPLPPTPIDAQAYADLGLPWSDYPGEPSLPLEPPDALTAVRSPDEVDAGVPPKRPWQERTVRIRPSTVHDTEEPHGRPYSPPRPPRE